MSKSGITCAPLLIIASLSFSARLLLVFTLTATATATTVKEMIASTATEIPMMNPWLLPTSGGGRRGSPTADCVGTWVGIGVPLGVECVWVAVQVDDDIELVQ